ncbi:hypothetical protein CP8484711_1448B, partial [Chlamydia psittaci 84-8471/1]
PQKYTNFKKKLNFQISIITLKEFILNHICKDCSYNF